MNILLSNDDGYFAKGLEVLFERLNKEYTITVVAPEKNCSGSSNALTLDVPIRNQQRDNGFYSVTGTPADCVHLATYHVMTTKPDIVVAGINHGANLGDDVLYSGTVAAAVEGRCLGFPSIAVSLVGHHGLHFETAAEVVSLILTRLKSHPLPNNRILNVNVPDIPFEQIKGFQTTRLGSRHRSDTIKPATDPKGNKVYWIGPTPGAQDEAEGTDFFAVEHGYVSITPLTIDLTAYDSFEQLNEWVSQL